MQYREERNPQTKPLRSALEQWTEIGSRWYVCEAKGAGVRRRVVVGLVAGRSTRALRELQVIKRCLVVPARWLYCTILNSGLVLLYCSAAGSGTLFSLSKHARDFQMLTRFNET